MGQGGTAGAEVDASMLQGPGISVDEPGHGVGGAGGAGREHPGPGATLKGLGSREPQRVASLPLYDPVCAGERSFCLWRRGGQD